MRYISRVFLLIALLAAATVAGARSRPGMTESPIPHPRLLMLEGEEPHIAAESLFAKADSVIVAFSDEVMGKPVLERTMIGRRLLGTSREALKRIFWLGYTYRTRGGEAYARRAIDEMLAVCAFSDWNPAHFLDVGEMTMAVAIGYDWLYDRMTPRERKTVAQAIIDKGLKPALNENDAWFYTSEINWNSVCNAGMVYGALAVWEEDPEFCRSMLEKSLESNKLSYKAYEGGGYPEGYNYWGYGTSFQIMLEAAVESAFRWPVAAGHDGETAAAGHDALSAMPDLIGHLPDEFFASSEFICFTSTPAGNCYSFSDAYRRAVGQYMQAWMLTKVGDPTLLYPEMRIMEEAGYKRLCEERLFPMLLISLTQAPPFTVSPPREHYYQCGGTTPIFVYRSGWKSREDDYLGIKGGLTMSSHSHCDQGSFYFESDGVAWATDLGMQDYNSLESAGVDLWDMTQDSERWSVFRIGPFSHNILTVNGHTPKVNKAIDFLRTRKPAQPVRGNPTGAALNLTPVYDDDLDYCLREVYFDGDNLQVVDNLYAGDSTCVIRWAMCSEAEATVSDDGSIILQAGDHRRRLSADFLDPSLSLYIPGEGRTTTVDVPALKPHSWPTTYDPATPDVDGMQYLHETDAPNPGTSLVGYTFTLQPHQMVVLHVVLSRVL